MTDTPTIEIHNVGPIEEFRCELAPGVTVLRGKHGAGKTTVLRTVQLATDGRADRKPAKSDGVPRGEATIAGRTLTITRTVRTEGELSVEGLGELSLDVLHCPKFDDAVIRDKHRIATLIRLAGVTADPTLFHDIVGGRESFDKAIDSDTVKTNDLVELAARIKRRLEKHAQNAETNYDTAMARQLAERQQADGVDLSLPCDNEALGAALREAMVAQNRINDRVAAADRAASAANQAQQRREQLPPARSIAALQINLDNATKECQDAIACVELARAVLAEAEKRQTAAQYARRSADDALSNALQEQAIRDELDRTIADHAAVDRPSDDDLDAAEKAVFSAQEACAYGQRVRMAKEAIKRAEGHVAEAQAASTAAKRMRTAAGQTQDVLSAAVAKIPNCPMRVIFDADGNARLVVKTERSDAELFDDLSDGQRWRVVLDIAAAAGKLLVLSQAAWGELSDGTRSQIDAMARERGCYVLTAQADDGDLRAETWAEQAAATAAAA